MGHIKQVLAEKTLEPRSVTPNMIWVDLCENLHIHYRNLRLEFSVEEFAVFMCAMQNLYKAAEHKMEDWKFEEGDPNFLTQIQFKKPLNNSSHYYPNRLVLEANRDGTFHLHYRDLRVHLSADEYDDLERAVVQGKARREAFVPFHEKYGINGLKEPRRMTVAIEDVQPYDAGHKPGGVCFDIAKEDATFDHEQGIEACMKEIEAGRKILPILVSTDGQRLDGYKRYMAHLRSGAREIEVIVDPAGKMGGQHGLGFLDEEQEVTEGTRCPTS